MTRRSSLRRPDSGASLGNSAPWDDKATTLVTPACPAHSRNALDHLATLTRNQVRFIDTQVTVPMLTEPTSIQREAFSPLGAPIPLTLK
jgi:hypothetical protein